MSCGAGHRFSWPAELDHGAQTANNDRLRLTAWNSNSLQGNNILAVAGDSHTNLFCKSSHASHSGASGKEPAWQAKSGSCTMVSVWALPPTRGSS